MHPHSIQQCLAPRASRSAALTTRAASALTASGWRVASLLLVLLLLAAPSPAAPANPTAPVVIMTIDGAIGPAAADHLRRGIARADDLGAAALLLQLDTPGGLDTSMREMIRMILASRVPVITWVHPPGARAASAGTFLLYASHVAAMSPGTNVGAATPIAIGGGGVLPGQGNRGRGGAQDGEKNGAPGTAPAPADAAASKAINDAVAYLRSLATLRGRDTDFAERAVRDAASLPADAALKQGVIDLVAADLDTLLQAVDGRPVKLGEREVTLQTAQAERIVHEADWRVRALASITHPQIALLLMMIGLYGLLFEFMSPGAIYPGVIGALCLLLGLYGLAALPISWVGAGLTLLGLALLLAEAFLPSFGLLGVAGVVTLAAGLALLVETDNLPGLSVSWPFVAGLAVAAGGLMLVTAHAAVRSASRPVTAGAGAMLGAPAEVIDWQGESGHVYVHGERWRARANQPLQLQPGQRVHVLAIDGLTVTVAAAGRSSGDPAS